MKWLKGWGDKRSEAMMNVRGYYEFKMMLNVEEAEAVRWEQGDRFPVLRRLQKELTSIIAKDEEHLCDMTLEFIADDDGLNLRSETPLDKL